jgi:uncharacterized protein YbaP (TraB family)
MTTLLRAALRPFVTVACAALFLVASPSAQDTAVPERPFFWRIEAAAGSGTPSWLLGTFHVADPRITTMHPATEQAFAEASAVFTELALDGKVVGEVMRRTLLPKGQRLRDVMPPELWQRLERHFATRRASLVALERMQPWAVAAGLVVEGHTGGDPFDLQIYKDAKNAGKEVGGLELVDEQMQVFERLGTDGGVAYLQQTLDLLDRYRAEGKVYIEQMIRAYAAGDDAALLRFFDEAAAMDQELWATLMKALLTDRNLRMVDRMAAKLRAAPSRSFFFAVGAGHCVGGDNLVELLRDRGFVVQRVPANAGDLDAEIEAVQRRLDALQRRLDALRGQRAGLEPRAEPAVPQGRGRQG